MRGTELTFDGNVILDTVEDPTQTYSDAVLADGNFYEYEVFRRTFADALLFYHVDHLGTPVAISDDGASLAWRVESLPFGGDLAVTGSGSNNVGFPGQYRDSESGLFQNWYRDYDARTARYREIDPLTSSRESNRYLYAENQPIRFADPLGLYTIDSNCGAARCKGASDLSDCVRNPDRSCAIMAIHGVRQRVRDSEPCRQALLANGVRDVEDLLEPTGGPLISCDKSPCWMSSDTGGISFPNPATGSRTHLCPKLFQRPNWEGVSQTMLHELLHLRLSDGPRLERILLACYPGHDPGTK